MKINKASGVYGISSEMITFRREKFLIVLHQLIVNISEKMSKNWEIATIYQYIKKGTN